LRCVFVIRLSARSGSAPAEALLALQHGDYTKAELLYRHLRAIDPHNVEFSDKLALALYSQGKDSQAIALLSQSSASERDPKEWVLLALSHCRLAQYTEAAASLRRLRPWPKDDALLGEIASCVLVAGDPLDAVELYENLVALHAQPETEYTVGLARAYIQASKFVLGHLKGLSNAEVYILAIDSAASNHSDAALAFESAKHAIPSLSREMPVSAMIQLFRQSSDQAAAVYGVGVILGERGIAAYLDAENRFPDSVPLKLLNADMLLSAKRDKEAIEIYRHILEEDPRSPGVHFRIGSVYGSNNDWNNALSEYRLQESITPGDERVRRAISICLGDTSRFQELFEYLQPIKNQPDAPEWTLTDFASAAEHTGHLDQAINTLQRVEATDPTNPDVRYRLFHLYRSTNNPAKAAQELGVFTKLKSASPDRGQAK
jgi:tetratricopeptide (TPR) repeat protein